jgi:hypothetical protein
MRRFRKAAVAASMVAVVAAISVTAALGASASSAVAKATPTASSCHLGNGVKHVVEILFDNTHYNRDNPNVLSDLEQMPALKNFITDHGTLLSNMHTPLIAHTADDSLTGYTGLYGDRHGQGLTNTYETYLPNGSVVPHSSFAYWTSTYGVDSFPNMPYSPKVPAAGSPPATPPAPWVPFTRAGCNVGDVSTANMVLENTNPDLANFFGPTSPEVQQLNADTDSFKQQETNDYVGVGVHCAQAASFCADAEAVKYGESAPSHTAVTDSLPDEPGGYTGYQALFGHKYLTSQLSAAANSGGDRTVNGHSYPVLDAQGNLTDLNGVTMRGNFKTPAVNAFTPGFPGFGPVSAAQTLAYTADMLETGVPVVYGYISDAHERKGQGPNPQSNCTNPSTAATAAQGPADRCYRANLASYNAAFEKFFQRLADDGITPSNTVFMFSSEEGDHFAGANVGRSIQPSCSGTPGTIDYDCSYAGTGASARIGEQFVQIHGLLKNQLGNTTPFYNEPQGNSIFITGNPGPTDQVTRQLERDFGSAQVFDSYDNATENLTQYEVDPTVEQLLHFVNADPNRTPSFTVFPKGDFFLTSNVNDIAATSTHPPILDGCPAGTTAANASTNCVSISNAFAWDHGYYAPEIDNTWLGIVGPGVANNGLDGRSAADGPNSADGANSNPQLVTPNDDPGTWGDETDLRPTLMALTGLKDDYVGDGRVLVEDLTNPPDKAGQPKFRRLAVCYKQLNSSVGQFGTDLIVADTAALKTGSSSDDSTYDSVLDQITSLGAARDALATKIKNDLFDAEFNNHPIPGANDLKNCEAIVAQANALAGTG